MLGEAGAGDIVIVVALVHWKMIVSPDDIFPPFVILGLLVRDISAKVTTIL